MTKSRYAYSIICVHENPEKKEYSQYTAAVTFSKASAFTIVLYNKTDIHEDLYETCYILKNSPGIIYTGCKQLWKFKWNYDKITKRYGYHVVEPDEKDLTLVG